MSTVAPALTATFPRTGWLLCGRLSWFHQGQDTHTHTHTHTRQRPHARPTGASWETGCSACDADGPIVAPNLSLDVSGGAGPSGCFQPKNPWMGGTSPRRIFKPSRSRRMGECQEGEEDERKEEVGEEAQEEEEEGHLGKQTTLRCRWLILKDSLRGSRMLGEAGGFLGMLGDAGEIPFLEHRWIEMVGIDSAFLGGE